MRRRLVSVAEVCDRPFPWAEQYCSMALDGLELFVESLAPDES
jgi:hypothetical protein